MEMGLALLANASMPLKYWDQAFLTTTHLINRTPTKLLDYDTPLHQLLGAAPDYSTLRVFGCACWSNLRPYNSQKLKFRSVHCAFHVYNSLHKGYKCLNISTSRVYVSQDVVFDEPIVPFTQLHPTVGARYNSDVLLLPDAMPRDSAILPLNNVHTNACLSLSVIAMLQLLKSLVIYLLLLLIPSGRLP